MSEMEYNKGRLTPVDWDCQEMFDELSGDYNQLSERYTVESWCRDNSFEYGYEMIAGDIYKATFNVKGGDLYDFCNVNKLPDGSIAFETYHYNGGGHWTELVEKELKDK